MKAKLILIFIILMITPVISSAYCQMPRVHTTEKKLTWEEMCWKPKKKKLKKRNTRAHILKANGKVKKRRMKEAKCQKKRRRVLIRKNRNKKPYGG